MQQGLRATSAISTSVMALAISITPLAAAELTFAPIARPATSQEKLGFSTTSGVTIGGRSHPLGFMPLIRPGDKLGDVVFGQTLDPAGKPLVDKDGKADICNKTDFTSLLPVGQKLFMVTQFECAPGAVYVTELSQDKSSGKLAAMSTKPVDFSAVGGGVRHCAGMVTPWNTHLASEEALIDAAAFAADGSHADVNYRALAKWAGQAKPNPYIWGWAPEVTVDEQGNGKVTKHYGMGRLALEIAYVMPDERTVFLSEDNTNSTLGLFVADKPKDLSAGRLYAGRWTQTSGEGAGAGDISWIDLGHATNAEIAAMIKEGRTFEQIFDKAKPAEDGACPAGFSSINAQFGQECLALKPGMEQAASRLETGRYAALKGATTEFRKMEGATYDPDHNKLYVAMSRIERGMLDKEKVWDAGGRNDLRLPANGCGTVYALDVAAGMSDTAGKPIDSRFAFNKMAGLVAGKPKKYEEAALAANKCDVEGISEPDNLTYLPGSNTLVIAEDTSNHEIDILWAMDVTSGKLTRIQSTPYGSEVTGTYWYGNLGGFGYLSSVIMEPFGDKDDVAEADRAAVTDDMRRSHVGVIGPFPRLFN